MMTPRTRSIANAENVVQYTEIPISRFGPSQAVLQKGNDDESLPQKEAVVNYLTYAQTYTTTKRKGTVIMWQASKKKSMRFFSASLIKLLKLLTIILRPPQRTDIIY
jgi:hypothetical protein